jgi:hypothetical protein
MPTLSEVFYVCLLTTVSGVVIKLASMAYKSKCRECSFCGIYIKRDVELEEREHEYDVAHQLQKRSSRSQDCDPLGSIENV